MPIKSLKERNQAVIKKQLLENEETKKLVKYFEKRFPGENPLSDLEKWNFVEGKVDLNALEQRLMEADLSSTFPQFLRAGINQITNSWYENTDVTYNEWVNTVPSSMATELYTPNHGPGFPKQVGEGELYPEVSVVAMDLSLRNWKYGTMLPVSKELMNDDKSGSMQRQIGMIGEYMATLTEVLCYAKLGGVASTYQQFQIPATETQPSYEANWPYASSSAPFQGGGFNRPTSYTILSQGAIQSGLIGLAGQKNLQGILMQVDPKKIIVSWRYRYDLSVLLNSAFYPSGASAAGVTGGAFAVNPIQGILDPVFARYMFTNLGAVDPQSYAWYIADAGKGFLHQMHTPVSVEQENPSSGESFNRDIFRYKASTRQNADYIDPRFFWRGNDGSVTS